MMVDAERGRRAAAVAVSEIEPPGLRSVIEEHLASGSAAPAVMALLAARVTGSHDTAPQPGGATDGHADGASDEVAHRGNWAKDEGQLFPNREGPGAHGPVDQAAAGTQLIYDGLRLTRQLVHENPWADVEEADVPADVDVVAADVLVARGFRLLADTAAADRAVETVRAFGRAEAHRNADRVPPGRGLEAVIFDLAVVAGADAAGSRPSTALRRYVVGLADAWGEPPLEDVDNLLPDRVESVMGRVHDDGAAPSAEESLAGARSATDPQP